MHKSLASYKQLLLSVKHLKNFVVERNDGKSINACLMDLQTRLQNKCILGRQKQNFVSLKKY